MSSLDQTIQFIAWFIALIELVVGLYILVLNSTHSANRHVSGLLILLAASTFAVGAMIGAHTWTQNIVPSVFLATSPAIQPALLVTALTLLKPGWRRGRGRIIWWLLHGLIAAIILVTLMDAILGIELWYTGIDPATYTGGYIPLSDYANGILAPVVQGLAYFIVGLGTIGILFYLALFDKAASENNKRLARLLFFTSILASIPSFALSRLLQPSVVAILPSAIYAAVYAYVGFQQMVSERRMQRGSLQVRLTTLILAVTLPVLVAMAAFLTNRAQAHFEEDAIDHLHNSNQTLSDTVSLWLDSNLKALQSLVLQPDILSMESARQKPLMEIMVATHPEMYLVSTTDLNGMNIARSDDEELKDYSDHAWVQGALAGNRVTYQTLIGRTSGRPALIVSVPIFKPRSNVQEPGKIIGVGMYAADLDEVANHVQTTVVGQEGVAYVVDTQNRLVAHPDPTQTAELKDYSDYPPVAALRHGKEGLFSFTDENDQRWNAYISTIDNGWGIVVQLPEQEVLAPLRDFQQITWTALIIGALALSLLAWLTIRQSIQPIQTLTATASAIMAGDLTRKAPVETEDELGVLASSFNNMTAQLRELIAGLENRVAERTQDLERRAVQLQVTADVAREAAAILDLEKLMMGVVHLISDRFGFYHAGIFLLDRPKASGHKGYAVLRAASSKGGQRMLARRHKLEIGEEGIVGYVAARGEPRIALDVGADAVFFNNPDLPLTRSEMALPLLVRDSVIGVLDVQSTQSEAFTQEDINILQTLADQIALAIENARLLTESQQAFRELETLYGLHIRQSWEKRLADKSLIYALDETGVKQVQPGDLQESADGYISSDGGTFVVKVPIELRGQRLGSLTLRRQRELGPWLPQEKQLVSEAVSQLALALENARLLEEIQRRATHEELINKIVAKTQGSLSLEAVMRTAVQEIGRSMNVARVQIHLGELNPEPHTDGVQETSAQRIHSQDKEHPENNDE